MSELHIELDMQAKEELHACLMGAYTLPDLQRMVTFHLGENLSQIVDSDGSFENITFQLILWAERKSWEGKLIAAAHHFNPTNRRLAKFARQYGVTLPSQKSTKTKNATGQFAYQTKKKKELQDEETLANTTVSRVGQYKSIIWFLGTVILSVILFALYTNLNNNNVVKIGPTICQVTDTGGIDDKSFNAIIWKGVQEAAKDFNGTAKYLESAQQIDYAHNIDAFIDERCDLIVTVGFLLGDATQAAAEKNPDQKFVIVDFAYDPDYENILGLIYNVNEAAFLAGYVAADQTKTGIVGTFGGINIPPVTQFMDGFVLGVDHYNKMNGTAIQSIGWNVKEQDGIFVGNFDSIDDGRTLGESLMDEGADIILPVAGPVGLGTAEEARKRGTRIIGTDTDWTESTEYGDVVLTSVLKRMDTTVYGAAELVANDEFVGGTFVGTLNNNGVGIVTDGFDNALINELEDITRMIIAGDLSASP